VALANAPPKAVADQSLTVKTRKNRRRVFTWFASRWRNHQPKRAEKPHSIIRNRKIPDGPATRPITPLAVENGVGKPAASERSAPVSLSRADIRRSLLRGLPASRRYSPRQAESAAS
jgi:hypothetical protein